MKITICHYWIWPLGKVTYCSYIDKRKKQFIHKSSGSTRTKSEKNTKEIWPIWHMAFDMHIYVNMGVKRSQPSFMAENLNILFLDFSFIFFIISFVFFSDFVGVLPDDLRINRFFLWSSYVQYVIFPKGQIQWWQKLIFTLV